MSQGVHYKSNENYTEAKMHGFMQSYSQSSKHFSCQLDSSIFKEFYNQFNLQFIKEETEAHTQ